MKNRIDYIIEALRKEDEDYVEAFKRGEICTTASFDVDIVREDRSKEVLQLKEDLQNYLDTPERFNRKRQKLNEKVIEGLSSLLKVYKHIDYDDWD